MAVLALLAVAGIMTIRLFDIKIDSPTPDRKPEITRKTAPEDGPVTEVVINLEDTEVTDTGKPVNTTGKPDQKPTTANPAAGKPGQTTGTLPAVAKAPGIGTITSLMGTAFVTRINQQKALLKTGSRVSMKETIETGAKSRLVVRFDDGTELTQGEQSSMILDEYVYNPKKKEDNGFSARFLKGACRVVTGAIVKMNPKRFQVKTRMATAGIRGTEIAFESDVGKDNIYLLELSGEHTVVVQTTTDGSAMMNAVTGEKIEINPDKQKTIILSKPGDKISVISGGGPRLGVMTAEEAKIVVSSTSHLPPAEYKINQTPGNSTIKIKPGTK